MVLLRSARMTQLIDEFNLLLASYPAWLVWGGLGVVVILLAWVIWRIIKFSMVIIVTALLLGIVGFVAYVIFTS